MLSTHSRKLLSNLGSSTSEGKKEKKKRGRGSRKEYNLILHSCHSLWLLPFHSCLHQVNRALVLDDLCDWEHGFKYCDIMVYWPYRTNISVLQPHWWLAGIYLLNIYSILLLVYLSMWNQFVHTYLTRIWYDYQYRMLKIKFDWLKPLRQDEYGIQHVNCMQFC